MKPELPQALLTAVQTTSTIYRIRYAGCSVWRVMLLCSWTPVQIYIIHFDCLACEISRP